MLCTHRTYQTTTFPFAKHIGARYLGRIRTFGVLQPTRFRNIAVITYVARARLHILYIHIFLGVVCELNLLHDADHTKHNITLSYDNTCVRTHLN